jgi:hypothetical protein
MNKLALVITSIANHDHPVLRKFAEECSVRDIHFIVIGDTKSPKGFDLMGCDFYAIERQQALNFKLAEALPLKHYARKNLGYLIAMSKGAESIIETDDDNYPLPNFWDTKRNTTNAPLLTEKGWVNVYKYYTDRHVWPRGFGLEHIQDSLPILEHPISVECPIHQGLADDNPDVDAIYRLILPLPIVFNKSNSIALGKNSFCPFNSQNTTWFKEAFPLLYLPSYCSFRMTDIWRSFVAQRVAWSCGWSILFHQSTVRQERNSHNLLNDLQDEMVGYTSSSTVMGALKNVNMKDGYENIYDNIRMCYRILIDVGVVGPQEIMLVNAWIEDIRSNIKSRNTGA